MYKFILALGLIGLSGSALAADAAWDAKFFNPKSAEGDVVLPMPCGGSMVFRKIAVPAEGPLGDVRLSLGGGDDALGYAEGSRPAYLAGAFPDGKSQRAFLMGKYEVSQLQYEAVMGSACPQPSLAKRLPQGEVGWFDAVAFSERYNEWLLKNAAKALPKDGEESGFVRLPTEVEWEYAARGGASVSPADFNERLPAMPEGTSKYIWFAGTQSANGKPQLSGLLSPSVLGLHDMLGNLDEIVLEPFRLNKAGRLHGQAGGFVVRGGNYLTAEQDIRSSLRQEVPYYDQSGPRRAKTTGFRVAVGGPVLTSAARLKDIQAAWAKLGASSAGDALPQQQTADLGAPAADPVEELAQLAKALPDPQVKARLEKLQSALKANIAARDEQRDRAAKTALRMGAFLGRKLSEDSKWVGDIRAIYEKQAKSDPDGARTKSTKESLDSNQAALDQSLRYYADTVIRIAEDYGDDTLARQHEALAVELKNLGLTDLIPFLDKHFDHVSAYRKDRKVSRQKWIEDWNKM